MFELGQVAVLGEDGFFQIVDEAKGGVVLAIVADAGEGLRIEAVSVGVRGGDGKLWLEEGDWQRRGARGGRDDLAAAGAARGTGVKEERNVGP